MPPPWDTVKVNQVSKCTCRGGTIDSHCAFYSNFTGEYKRWGQQHNNKTGMAINSSFPCYFLLFKPNITNILLGRNKLKELKNMWCQKNSNRCWISTWSSIIFFNRALNANSSKGKTKICVSDLTWQTFSPDWAAKKQPVVIFCLKYGWLFVLHKSKNVFWALVIYEPRLLLFLENCLVYFFHQITNLYKRMFGHSKGRHVCLWFRQKSTGTFTVKQV